jgi:hypothetical protein
VCSNHTGVGDLYLLFLVGWRGCWNGGFFAGGEPLKANVRGFGSYACGEALERSVCCRNRLGIDGGEYAPVWLGIMLGMNFGAQVYIRKHRGNRLCWSRLVPSTAMLIRDSAGSETLDGSVKITVMTRPVLSCVEERMLGFPAR